MVILILVQRSADRILSTTSGSRDKLQDDQRAVKEISSQGKEWLEVSELEHEFELSSNAT